MTLQEAAESLVVRWLVSNDAGGIVEPLVASDRNSKSKNND